MHSCTCHIRNLRCKNEKCQLLIQARGNFKSGVCDILIHLMSYLHKNGFNKKECLRAFRRELNHKNNIQYDIFDEVALQVWGKDEFNKPKGMY